MPISDSKRRADRKWRESNYDKICIHFPKGTRDAWKEEAQKRNISLAQLVYTAVSEYLEKKVNL